MVKYKVVCMGLNDKFIVDHQYGGLETVSEDTRHTYYKMKDELVELIFIQQIADAKPFIVTSPREMLFLILDEITDAHLPLLQLARQAQAIILSANVNVSEDIKVSQNALLTSIIQFTLVSDFNIQMFLMLVSYYVLVDEPIQSYNKLLIGYEKTNEPVGKIVMQILNSFQALQSCQSFELSLLTQTKLNLADLSYIEDPIYEYIPSTYALKIKNYTTQLRNNMTYYFMAGRD